MSSNCESDCCSSSSSGSQCTTTAAFSSKLVTRPSLTASSTAATTSASASASASATATASRGSQRSETASSSSHNEALGSGAVECPESARAVREASDAAAATLPHISQLVNRQLDEISGDGDGGGDGVMSATLELLEEFEATRCDQMDNGARRAFGELCAELQQLADTRTSQVEQLDYLIDMADLLLAGHASHVRELLDFRPTVTTLSAPERWPSPHSQSHSPPPHRAGLAEAVESPIGIGMRQRLRHTQKARERSPSPAEKKRNKHRKAQFDHNELKKIHDLLALGRDEFESTSRCRTLAEYGRRVAQRAIDELSRQVPGYKCTHSEWTFQQRVANTYKDILREQLMATAAPAPAASSDQLATASSLSSLVSASLRFC